MKRSKSLSLKAFKAFIVVSLLLIAGYSRAEDSTITIDSTGMAAIRGNDAAVARDAAIADALRKAVEQAVGALVSSDSVVENLQAVSDNIYSRSDGFVKNYTVTGESQAQGTYQVRVRAQVLKGDLLEGLDAIRLLHKKTEHPRVLFMIAEKTPEKSYYGSWHRQEKGVSPAEAALKEAFVKKGFNVVEASAANGSLEGYGISDLTGEGARAAGRKLNAEIVVYGKAITRTGPRTPGSAIWLFMSDVTAEAVRVEDGGIIAVGAGRGLARNVSAQSGAAEAASAASKEAAEKIMTQLLSRWSGPQQVTIKLRAADYNKAVEFKRLLKSKARGVEAVFQRGYVSGVASFEVEAKASAQGIADDISRFGGFKVVGAASDAIEVESVD